MIREHSIKNNKMASALVRQVQIGESDYIFMLYSIRVNEM